MSLRHFGQPKVENLSVPALRNEGVRGLDVAMDDARGVRGVQCVRHLHRHRQQRLQFHRPTRDQVLERDTIQKYVRCGSGGN